MATSEDHRKGNIQHESGLFSGDMFPAIIRDKRQSVDMKAEDRFAAARYTNKKLLSEKFNRNDENEELKSDVFNSSSSIDIYADMDSSRPFSQRLKSMKSRLGSRGSPLFGQLSSRRNVANQRPYFNDDTSNSKVWIGDMISNRLS